MTFVLSVNFRGMCTFVPQWDGQRAWVLLQNLSEFKKPGMEVEAHKACIKIRPENLKASAAIPRPINLIWPLGGADVEFLPGGHMPAGRLEIPGLPLAGSAPDLTRPDVVSPESFLWLAALEAASLKSGNPPGAGLVDSSLLTDEDKAKTLAARVHLRSGRLYTSARAVVGDQYIVWRFKPYEGCFFRRGHRQILATQATLEMKVNEAFVRISVRQLGLGSTYQLDLYPVGKFLELEVLNEESEQVVIGGKLPSPVLGRPRSQDVIFESGYDISRAPDARRKPIPVALRLVGKVGNDGGAHNAPPCSPSRMEPVAIMS